MLQLYIGNKNYSSWSLRAWFLLEHFGIPFEEIQLRLFQPEFYARLARVSPAAKVPVLVDDGFAVWETLAIAEYLAERFPQHRIWPAEARARARARTVCAEMHAGFSELRNRMPMNIEADLAGMGWSLAVQRDIDRISALWADALRESGGPFLFGAPSAAEAFFAPVCLRFASYRPALSAADERYVAAVLALPAMQRWISAARAEADFVADDEPYRRSRT